VSEPRATAAGQGRRVLLLVVGIAVSVLATFLVLRGMDIAQTGAILSRAQVPLLIAILGVVATQALLRAARWRLLLPRGTTGRPIPVRRVLGPMLVGYLGNALMPARLGEVVRAALIARREAISPAEAFGSAVLERIVDVFVLAALGILAALAVAAPGWMVTAAVAGALVAGVGLAVVAVAGAAAARGGKAVTAPWGGALTRIGRHVARLAAGARVIDRPSVVAGAALLTLAAWLLDATIFWLAARSLGLELAPLGAMLVSAGAVLSTAVPTAPGYVGTFELAAVAAAGAAGIVGEPALAFAVLVHVITLVPLSLAGAISLWAMGGRSLRGLTAARPTVQAAP